MDNTSFAPGGKSAKPNFTTPELPPPHKPFNNKKFLVALITILVVAGAAYAAIWYWQKQNAAVPSPSATPTQIIYRNDQYGFEIDLPQSWAGYTVLNNTWTGNVSCATGVCSKTTGPEIVLRNPNWTAEQHWEDMPVMVFTPSQWQQVQKGDIVTSAAPFPPSMLGQNSKYILALPPRYNYDFSTGYQEVDQLVHQLKAFEPSSTADTSNWQTYTNPQYGFSFKYPNGWSARELSYDNENGVASWVVLKNPEVIQFSTYPTNGPSKVIPQGTIQKNIEALDQLYKSDITQNSQISIPDGVAYYGIKTTGDGGDILEANIISPNTILLVSFNSSSGISDQNQTLFKDFLSTFQFMNQANVGTLTGHVTVGPNCPVEQANNPCTPAPEAYTSRQVGAFTQAGALVASTHLDTNGDYKLSLNPGTYVIKASGINVNQMSVTKGTVTIKSGQTTTLNFSIDTGIR